IRIDCFRRSFGEVGAERDHVFGAELLGLFMGYGVDFRIENYLADAASVAQVDENNPSMVAPASHPTEKSQLSAHCFCPRLTAVTTALPISQLIGKNPLRRHQFAFLVNNSASILSHPFSSCCLVSILRNTALPFANSSSPMINTKPALSLSARRIWLFKLRDSPSISTDRPLCRSRCTRGKAQSRAISPTQT